MPRGARQDLHEPVHPIWVGETTLAGLGGLEVDPAFRAARLLVTDHGDVLGQVTVPLVDGRADAADLRAAIEAELPAAPARVVPSSLEPLTVVVATRGRPESLARCLRSLLAGDHPDVRVIVVDNDRQDRRTEQAVAALGDPRVRYVAEPRRGTSVGRNRGLGEATTRLVAFIDDDTEVGVCWARRMAGALAADPELACVSGPVFAARLTTAQEQAADVALGWNKGFLPRRYCLAEPPDDSPIFPFSPGLFGIGANLAVRADAARAVGGFDESFGPGTATRSGEDCEFLVRLVLSGYTLGYEPSAYLWHHHRPDAGALREQVEGYAVGLAGFLTKVALSHAGRGAALRRLPAALRQLGRIAQRDAAAAEAAPGPGGSRARGLLTGPWVYLRTRRAVRRAGGRVPPLVPPGGRALPVAPPTPDGAGDERAARPAFASH